MNVDAFAATKNDVRPLTGAEYLDSLRDNRSVCIYGKRVADVTKHPAFRNSARMVARLYDSLHAPETKDVLTCPTDTGNGGFTHRFFRVDRSAEEVRGTRDAIAQRLLRRAAGEADETALGRDRLGIWRPARIV